MAKKVKKEYAPQAVAGSPKPCLYLDFQGKDVAQITGLKIGEEVEIVVRGKVKGLSQRERPDYDDDKKVVKTGTIDLENYRVQVLEEETNVFAALAEDDA